jgi:hypothetical protein
LVERFGKRAAQAYVLVFGPDLRVVAGPVAGGREVNTDANGAVWNRADVPFQPTEEGEYVFLVCAQDDERDRYKGHLPRWALQRGVKRLIPLAVNYDFQNYPNPPPAGTTPHAQRAANDQRRLVDGTFYLSRAFTNHTAQQALEQLRQAAVFFVFGHGGDAGWQFRQFQTFWNGAWSVMVQTREGRDLLVRTGLPANQIVVLDDLPAGALNRALLVVFEGCRTAYYNDTWGSPVWGVRIKGARCALGFTETIYSHDNNNPGAEEWADRFWALLCSEGRTVRQAAYEALNIRPSIPPNKRLHSYRIEGDGNLRIHPARYNSGQ